ncbi:inner centromere protein-like [Passer domesticus]|uniref:inner centromere protein-like n=1 Tax=Passer domesticus TaxID=48849 RepID=UPI0030FE28FC
MTMESSFSALLLQKSSTKTTKSSHSSKKNSKSVKEWDLVPPEICRGQEGEEVWKEHRIYSLVQFANNALPQREKREEKRREEKRREEKRREEKRREEKRREEKRREEKRRVYVEYLFVLLSQLLWLLIL